MSKLTDKARGAVALSKRQFLSSAVAFSVGAYFARPSFVLADQDQEYDVIVVGGGNSGLPAAVMAAERGAKVLIVEAAPVLGGTLLMSGGRMSAAGTKLQKSLGIEDHPDIHYDDVMALSNGTANPEILRLAVDRAPIAFDWLMDNGFVPLEGLPVKRGQTHAGQSRPRYVWSEDAGKGINNVLQRALTPYLESGQVITQMSTRVTGLDVNADGAIEGVAGITNQGQEKHWRGRNVVLASGGYTANSELFAELEGALDYAENSYPFNKGIGIELGLSAGGYLRGGEDHLPSFGAILAGDKVPSGSLGGLDHHPHNRKPWEIWVNAKGERFIAEDNPNIHDKELALLDQSHERFWVVFDDAVFRQAPPAVRKWSRDDMERAFNNYPSFVSAASLSELAERAGIDRVGLARSVDAYNLAQKSGSDVLGREHMPLPIEQGPYYAVRVQSSQLISFAGLAVDSELRVLRSDQTAIPNLFAAGELIGAGQLMGQCYSGGMMVTPALAFGHLLGREVIPLAS